MAATDLEQQPDGTPASPNASDLLDAIVDVMDRHYVEQTRPQDAVDEIHDLLLNSGWVD
jgi:hypothetical protein